MWTYSVIAVYYGNRIYYQSISDQGKILLNIYCCSRYVEVDSYFYMHHQTAAKLSLAASCWIMSLNDTSHQNCFNSTCCGWKWGCIILFNMIINLSWLCGYFMLTGLCLTGLLDSHEHMTIRFKCTSMYTTWIFVKPRKDLLVHIS